MLQVLFSSGVEKERGEMDRYGEFFPRDLIWILKAKVRILVANYLSFS